uniref:Uncharacterized protein n=1 Tax=virus sp. ctDJ83 TaxID=2827625 RepID=A0A8S5RJM4_9VIRU|nr:MAG TPA: hypothetical protein [virus sp. ctDJ83]
MRLAPLVVSLQCKDITSFLVAQTFDKISCYFIFN